ncbi:hypothetical protein MTR67_028536 [Solanum verrucosum]|uniref:CUE domain-containing protein n=1 Tax=Solanum verrucosum TaxID=315347 RepID=A0AAF0TWG2_SOLVR|nr:hypothetical protein MTR67_028536 [Solanum verrucosum]
MSAMVCGKRSFFEDLQSPSPTSPSTPVSKKLRCSSTSPRRFSPPPPAAASIDHLRALFPDVDCQFLEKTLEECGNDLDVAIKRLHELHLIHAQGKSVSASEADGEMDGGMYKFLSKELIDVPTYQLIRILLTKSRFSSIAGKGSYLHAKFAGIVNTAFVLNNPPADGTEWVELFVREMMSATSTDDARARATIVLESLEKSISASASAEAAQNFQKVGIVHLSIFLLTFACHSIFTIFQENMMLKEQIELILRDNIILKRLVAIQHERQKEHNDDRIQEVQQLKQLIAQYQEQLRTLEVNNYSLKMHLQQTQQCNSIPGHFHPDVF